MRGWLTACLLAAAACSGGSRFEPVPAHPTSAPASDPIEKALDEVAAVHGAPGPWAVAGYRMATHALAKLGLQRGSFDLEVVHQSPKQVQFSCIADGAAAYSKASVGKLNLSHVEANEAALGTTYRNKKTGASITLRPSAAFRAKYYNHPMDHVRDLGREVMNLPDADVFEEVAAR